MKRPRKRRAPKGTPHRINTAYSVRTAPDQGESIAVLSNLTGWSDNKCITTVMSAGFAQLASSPDPKLDSQAVKNIRELIKAATVQRQIEVSSLETVRRARGAVRQIERRIRAKR